MTATENGQEPAFGGRRGTIGVLAAGCGLMVSNVYLCQPLLDRIATDFKVSDRSAGLVAVATQVGYALGILLVVPLADVSEPRRLIRILAGLTSLGLLAAAVSPTLPLLIVASLAIAASTVVAQILIPLATSLAPPERRGRLIGALQTGLILGILLSRTVSGATAQATGTWRASYLLGAILTGSFVLVLPPYLPKREGPPRQKSYLALLASLPPLLKHKPLRISMTLGFCTFAAFSAFWATLAFHLGSPKYALGPAAIGLFGLWGAPGALLATRAGRLSDRVGPDPVNLLGQLFLAAGLAVASLPTGLALLTLVLGVNLLDFGQQSGQIANQARIFALGNDIRARLNTLYMVATFSGGAFGSLAGTTAWSFAGWQGVCLVATGFVALAGVVSLAAFRSRD